MQVREELYKHCFIRCSYRAARQGKKLFWWPWHTSSSIRLQDKFSLSAVDPRSSSYKFLACLCNMHLTLTSFLTYQDQDAVMGTVWRELRGSAGFLDPGCVSGEPVHQRATGKARHPGRTV